MTYNELRGLWIQARKNKYQLDVKVLSGIIDKTQKLAKVSSSEVLDNYLIIAIKSEYKGYLDSSEKGISCKDEIYFIEQFLPKVLNEEQTKAEIEKFLSSLPSCKMGDIMKNFKGREDLDMKLVQEITKGLLK